MKAPQKSLKKWTKQKWGYVTKSDSKKPRSKRGRYLPKAVRASLTKGQKAYTNRQKRKANKNIIILKEMLGLNDNQIKDLKDSGAILE